MGLKVRNSQRSVVSIDGTNLECVFSGSAANAEELILTSKELMVPGEVHKRLANCSHLPNLKTLSFGQVRKRSRILDTASPTFFRDLPDGPLWAQLETVRIGICPYQQFQNMKTDWVAQLQERRFRTPTIEIVDVFSLLKRRPLTWIRHDETRVHRIVELLYDPYKKTNYQLDIAPFLKRLDPNQLTTLTFLPLVPIQYDEDQDSLIELSKRFRAVRRLPPLPNATKKNAKKSESELARDHFVAGLDVAFSEKVHRAHLQSLADLKSSAAAGAYVYRLAKRVKLWRPRDRFSASPKRAKEIVEVAQLARQWTENASAEPFRKYLFTEAMWAALDLFDYAATREFHTISEQILAKPRVFDYDNWSEKYNFSGPDSDEFAHLQDVISGVAEKNREELKHRQHPLVGLSELELGQLAGTAIGQILLEDPDTAQVWALDPFYRFLYFDGSTFCDPPFRYEDQPSNDVALIGDAVCDQRVSLWKGKMQYHLIHRYGKAVRWNPGRITRDSYTIMYTHWFVCPTVDQATALVELIEGSVSPAYTRNSSWVLDKGRGVIMREYEGGWVKIGVHGRRWVKGIMEFSVHSEFQSSEEAVERFEAAELEKLRAGVTLKSVRVEDKWIDGSRFTKDPPT